MLVLSCQDHNGQVPQQPRPFLALPHPHHSLFREQEQQLQTMLDEVCERENQLVAQMKELQQLKASEPRPNSTNGTKLGAGANRRSVVPGVVMCCHRCYNQCRRHKRSMFVLRARIEIDHPPDTNTLQSGSVHGSIYVQRDPKSCIGTSCKHGLGTCSTHRRVKSTVPAEDAEATSVWPRSFS